MEQLFNYVLARVAERSTWIGLISLLTAAGITIDPSQAAILASVAAAIAGAIMMITKDHKPVAQVAIETAAEIVKDIADEKANSAVATTTVTVTK